jgi:predicted anti-sigma-YlaC factor YlaD
MKNQTLNILIFLCAIMLLGSGCSIKSIALNGVGDALSGGGSVFTSDNDPELIKDALPFALKMYESVLDGAPEHKPLILSTSKSFCMYAYAFLQMEAEKENADNYPKAQELRARAKNLFLRSRDYALKGLELNHPGFRELLKKDVKAALAMTNKEDTGLLYWCGAAWVAALTTDKSDVQLMVDMQTGGEMVGRVLELDEKFGDGSAHGFFISYDGGRSPAMGGSEKRAREHFARAVELSQGKDCSPYLSLAMSVSVTNQNAAEFKELLAKALAIDADKYPENRLANIIYQRRARWLLEHIGDYFLSEEKE